MTDPRDRLAEMDGWKLKSERWYHPVWHKLGSGQKRHPHPPTLDGAAAAMPEGWWFTCEADYWIAHSPVSDMSFILTIPILRTKDETRDRYALALAVREYMESKR